MCLSKQASLYKPEDISLPRNLSVYRKLRGRYVLKYKPQDSILV
jgi:hypothetical protein